jgi:hypothetical protein
MIDRTDHEAHRAYAVTIGAPEFFGMRCTRPRQADSKGRIRGGLCGGQDYCADTGQCLRCGYVPRPVKEQ